MKKKVVVIGAGISGLSAACFLAQAGYEVEVLEQHSMPGGRARFWETSGYRFDMGPSWYWMPDIFEDFFAHFGKKPSDYYDLTRLDPSYSVYFSLQERTDIPAGLKAFEQFCELKEPGCSQKLREFLEKARFKYETGMYDYARKPSLSFSEFLDPKLITKGMSVQLFSSLRTHVEKYISHPHLKALLEFPVLFLGSSPQNTPAMYSLMAYADIVLGTWYPMGGMYKVVEGLYSLALELGVTFQFNVAVTKFHITNGSIDKILTADDSVSADVIVSTADYHHVETQLLPTEYRSYPLSYWKSRVMAPSCILFYLGLSKKIPDIHHHTLFFDEDLDIHTDDIYARPQWPHDPLFYVCAPSVTDSSVAPPGCENLFVLVPVATELEENAHIISRYREYTLEKMETAFGCSIRDSIVVERSYSRKNFIEDYNALRGNAYGLANTLSQTALLKPSMRSQRVKNLFFAGQLTVPGPGVPPSLLSGQMVAGCVKSAFEC
jgi:phytoene desaturase